MDKRTELYSTVNVAMQDVADAHAKDVAMAASALHHLGAILNLVEAQGWKTTWGQDSAVLDEAKEFMVRVSEDEKDEAGEHDGNEA